MTLTIYYGAQVDRKRTRIGPEVECEESTSVEILQFLGMKFLFCENFLITGQFDKADYKAYSAPYKLSCDKACTRSLAKFTKSNQFYDSIYFINNSGR